MCARVCVHVCPAWTCFLSPLLGALFVDDLRLVVRLVLRVRAGGGGGDDGGVTAVVTVAVMVDDGGVACARACVCGVVSGGCGSFCDAHLRLGPAELAVAFRLVVGLALVVQFVHPTHSSVYMNWGANGCGYGYGPSFHFIRRQNVVTNKSVNGAGAGRVASVGFWDVSAQRPREILNIGKERLLCT